MVRVGLLAFVGVCLGLGAPNGHPIFFPPKPATPPNANYLNPTSTHHQHYAPADRGLRAAHPPPLTHPNPQTHPKHTPNTPPNTHTQIADSMLKLYGAYADFIAAEIAGGGPHAARSSGVKYMRGVKRSVLRLVEVRGEGGGRFEWAGAGLGCSSALSHPLPHPRLETTRQHHTNHPANPPFHPPNQPQLNPSPPPGVCRQV